MIKTIGKIKRSNCWWEIFKLLISRRLSEILIKKIRRFELPHISGRTKKGNVIQFKRVGGKAKRFSLILRGQLRVVPSETWERLGEDKIFWRVEL